MTPDDQLRSLCAVQNLVCTESLSITVKLRRPERRWSHGNWGKGLCSEAGPDTGIWFIWRQFWEAGRGGGKWDKTGQSISNMEASGGSDPLGSLGPSRHVPGGYFPQKARRVS